MLEMKYFVLRPGKNDDHGRASQEAMLTYATLIENTDPERAGELRRWVKRCRSTLTRTEPGGSC